MLMRENNSILLMTVNEFLQGGSFLEKKRKNQNAGARKEAYSAVMLRLAVLFIMGIAIILYFLLEKSAWLPQGEAAQAYTFDSTGVILDFAIEDRADFYVTDKGNFFFITKDGVRYYTSSGEKKWDKVFNMIHPVIYGEGEMLAVAEQKGKELYVYNTEGQRNILEFEYPILRFSINRAGYVSVILQRDNDYELHVYDEKGGRCWQWNNENYNVFPVACAASNDGRIVAVSLFDINDVKPESLIMFAYIEDTVQNNKYSDRIFSSKMRSNQLVGDLRFMEDRMVVSISDEEITGMQIVESSDLTDKVTDIWAIPFTNKIDKISYNGGKGFALAFGEGLLNKQSEPAGTVKYYDLKGQCTSEFQTGERLTFLWTGSDAMVIGTTAGAYAVNTKGKRLWEHKAGLQTKQVMILGNTNNILMVTNTRAELLKRLKN